MSKQCDAAGRAGGTVCSGAGRVVGYGRWDQGGKRLSVFHVRKALVTVSYADQGPFGELIYGGTFDDLRQVKLYPYGFAWYLHTEE